MLVATAELPLMGCLRQGKEVRTEFFKIELRSAYSKAVVGSIDLQVMNEGEPIPIRDQENYVEITKFNKENTENKNRGHIHISKEMDLEKELTLMRETEIDDEDRRKEYRVRRYKMLQAQRREKERTSKGHLDDIRHPTGNTDEFKSMMNQIKMIRNKKKQALMNNQVQLITDKTHRMSCNYGQAKYFTYKVFNDTAKTRDYEVKINYGHGFGHLLLDKNNEIIHSDLNDMNNRGFWRELDVVREPTEWKYLCENEHFMHPPEFGMIVKGDIFVLGPGDSVELIFKYLSYDDDYKYDEER
jgi:hypothetical protein